ncbi:MAG: hypothetical protein JSR96_09520 [Proteobacteria bacterium]|nr:hypothetical protein [Pseudomonadota bacterium]
MNSTDHPAQPRVRMPEARGDYSATAAGFSLLLTLIGLTGALMWTCLYRGPWYDEFYTWAVTDPTRGFVAALQQSWLADNHPPLFYMLAWTGRHLSATIEDLRLINLAALLVSGIAGWLIVRRVPRMWLVSAVMMLVLAADPMALLHGSEVRSYFMSLCAGAVVVLGLVAAWLGNGFARRRAQLAWAIALLAGLNLHIITTIILGSLVLPFLASALASGRRKLFRQMLVPALIAGAVFLATCAVQAARWETNTASFWIPSGFHAAAYAIRLAVQRAAEANLAVLIGALAGSALLAGRAAWLREMPERLSVMLLLGTGITLAAILLVGLHMLRPVVMERYLAALIPAVAAGMALPFAAALAALRASWRAIVLALATALTLFVLVGNAREAASRNSWLGSAAVVARVQHACPDAPVHIDPPFWNATTMALPPADNKAVFGMAHAMMARRFGFRIEPAGSRRVSPRCPTLFWAEHDPARQWNEQTITARLQAQGYPINRVWLYRIGHGWIAADHPLADAAASH